MRAAAACRLILLLSWGAVRAGDPAALAARAPKLPQPPEVSNDDIDAAVRRGRMFLLKNQNKDGSWGNARKTKGLNIYSPTPGAHRAFRAAVSALCLAALLETDTVSTNKPELIQARTWLLNNLAKVKRSSPDTLYNIWAHCYGLHVSLRMLDHQKLNWGEKRRVKKLANLQIDRLQDYETVHGGWAYYNFGPLTRKPSSYSNSFANAAILAALREARSRDFDVPKPLTRRAVKALQRQRKPDCSYLYSEDFKYHTGLPVNRPGGSLGRSQAANHALTVWGDRKITPAIHEAWLNRFVARIGWLDQARKRPRPHESWFAVAGYYFYFGVYYAGCNVRHLPGKKRPAYYAHLARILIDRQEKDGSWWDFPLYNYHKFYGTPFALMTLERCRAER